VKLGAGLNGWWRQGRHGDRQAGFEGLVTTVLDGPGTLAPQLRRAAFDGGSGLAVTDARLPPELCDYVDTVARHAYRLTDADVEGLRRAGWSDDELFELTVAAAMGAGARRLLAGLAALEGAP
jgi:alkylhydroperoxidase family enzyme